MSIDPKIFDRPRELSPAALAAIPQPDVTALVPALLDRWLGTTRPDHELLERAAKTLAKVGHTGLERPALGWLDADPDDPRRLELVAWFLGGYWREAAPELPETRTRLFEVMDRLDPASMAYMGVVWALAMVVASRAPVDQEERARLREALLRHLDHMESTGQLPGLVSQLQWLRGRAKKG